MKKKKRNKSKTNKKYWLIPTISYGISIGLLILLVNVGGVGEIGTILWFVVTIIGIISSFFMKSKQWSIAAIGFLVFAGIALTRGIINETDFGCTFIGISGGLDSNEISGITYRGFNKYDCKTQNTIITILAIIQYIFLILGTIGFVKAVYLSTKKDNNK
ncbi:MAG: hypothetical protein IJL74_04710 [Bacilli bacterium]|nr:hypothetical protein [Bacilli bacterium]